LEYLAAELASVFGVLGDLSLLEDLTDGSTIASTVLTRDTGLDSPATLTHKENSSERCAGAGNLEKKSAPCFYNVKKNKVIGLEISNAQEPSARKERKKGPPRFFLGQFVRHFPSVAAACEYVLD